MHWIKQNNRLTKTFAESGFSEVITKLNILSEYADTQKHHPDFAVFEYNKIRFELWTHEQNSITAADYKMAEYIDSLFTKGV